MISALISFFGGNVFRMLWGEISAMLTARQDHRHEIERLRLQAEIDAAQHARNQDAIRLQADLGVKTVQVQAEADIGRIEGEGWLEAVKGTAKQVGVAWVDAWNAAIRPGLATTSIGLIVCDAFKIIVMSENAWALSGAALGIYVADRSLFRRGK